jgi:superfamily I DNA/RNA helicase
VAHEVRLLRALVEQLKERLEHGLDAVLQEVLHVIVHDTGTRQQLLALFNQAGAESGAQTLKDLLTGLQVSLGGYEQVVKPGKVKIMTMHQAKGLTARAVILVGVEDEFLPGRSEGTPREDDERRLLYVSLTRAKEFLLMTHCEKRRGQQRRMGSMPNQLRRTLTRFLQDAPVRSEDGMAFISGLSNR